MTKRWLLAGIVLAGAFGATTFVAAQTPTGFRTLPCEESFLSIDDSLTCSTAVGRGANDSQAISDRHQTWGNVNGATLNILLATAGHQTYFRPYGEDASAAFIKGYHRVTRERALNWSSVKTQGSTTYMTFTADNLGCIGFDHAGPLALGGYEWLMLGYICLPVGQAASFEALKPYLAALRIGPPARNRNAFGQAVAPLPSSLKPM